MLRSLQLLVSWGSASYADLDGEFCIVVKQMLNWLRIAVLLVIHASHRLTLLLYRSKYEFYRFCTGLHKALYGLSWVITISEQMSRLASSGQICSTDFDV